MFGKRFRIVVAALQQLLHLLDGRLTRVGTRAGVADRVDRDVVQSCEEHVLGNEALLAGIAVRTVVLDAVRDVQVVVHLAQILDEERDLLIVVLAAETHVVRDNAVTLLRGGILRVERDDLGQIHCVCRAVNDVRAVVRKRRARLVRHGVHDAEQRVGERHTRKALRVVHAVAFCHVAVIGIDKVILDHLDREDRQRIGIIAVRGGDIRLDRVRHCVHTRVRNELLGHRLGEVRIDDRDVGRDLEVCNRVFDTLLVVGDDGERRDFRRRAARGGDGAELRLLSQFGDAEHLAHILKGDVGILVLDPHCLCGVDGRTAAHGDDPVGTEIEHRLRALHDRFDGGIGFDALEELYFHACLFEVGDRLIEEAEFLHRAAADADDRLLTFQRFERFERALAVIEVSG